MPIHLTDCVIEALAEVPEGRSLLEYGEDGSLVITVPIRLTASAGRRDWSLASPTRLS